MLAGGVESMSRAPYVMSKSATPFARDVQMFDTTIGWRFVNPLLKKKYGVDSMPETGENVAERIPHLARGSGPLRAAQPAARTRRTGRAAFRRGDRRGCGPGKARRDHAW